MSIEEMIRKIAREEAEAAAAAAVSAATTDIIKSNERPKYATPDEVCVRLHITKQTLQNYLNSGIFTRYKVGRRLLISWNEVETALSGPVKNRRS